MTGGYAADDIRRVEQETASTVHYVFETASTMDLAMDCPAPGLVLTDHQTAGRGRYDRTWNDTPGGSILATFVRAIPDRLMPDDDSLVLAHLFVLAVRHAIGSDAVMIKWPNDLMIGVKKLGGVLLARDAPRGNVLFGAGLNVLADAAPDGSASLETVIDHPERTNILIVICRTLDAYLADLSRLHDPDARKFYDDTWAHASLLVGRTVTIVEPGHPDISGVVVASPFGGPLQLVLSDGIIMDVTSYGRNARIMMAE